MLQDSNTFCLPVLLLVPSSGERFFLLRSSPKLSTKDWILSLAARAEDLIGFVLQMVIAGKVRNRELSTTITGRTCIWRIYLSERERVETQ